MKRRCKRNEEIFANMVRRTHIKYRKRYDGFCTVCLCISDNGQCAYVSLITLLAYLPTMLLSPLGGVLADRYDRRLLMIIGDLFSGLGLAYVLWNIQIGSDSMLPIFIGVTFNAVFVALLEPSFRATITELLTEDEYAKAITYTMIFLLRALTDLMMAMVFILTGVLLIAIAVVCLRYVVLAQLEDDMREIGTMKAIGIPQKGICRLYLGKIRILMASGCVTGYALA